MADQSNAQELRRLLERDEPLVVPGAFGALPARMIERAGFEAVYLTGAGVAAAEFGVPDIGLVTMSETAAIARNIVRAVSVPVIADADTGYGNAINVFRTVQDFGAAGVAGIQLEDQVWPKKCGHLGGKRLIDASEMVGKLAAAREASSDMVIIARCDAVAVEGLQAALARGTAYVDAGADVLFIEAPESLDDLKTVADRFTGVPLLFNMAASGRTPFMSADDAFRLGFKLVILPNYALLAAIKAMRSVLEGLRANGDVREILNQTVAFSEMLDLVGLESIQAMESRFSTPAATTYEGR